MLVTTRVMHLIKGLGPGGAEQLLVNQAGASQFDNLSFDAAYLVSYKNHLVPSLEANGWRTHCLRSDRAWDLRWLIGLRRLIIARDIAVVHGHSPLVSSFARLVLRTIPKKRRPRSVYTEHNEWGRHRQWTRRFNRLTIGLEDHRIAVSEAVRSSMPKDLQVDVIVHGIDVAAVAAQSSQRARVRDELGIAEGECVIGTVANFRREKAYDVLLDAAAMVIADSPHVRFVSVGQGPLEREMRARHAELDLGDRFLILGYRNDATRVMSAFDIFTLSSLHEGLPVSLMDAMALGLRVVATSVGGVPESLEDWEAILVAPGDPQALADAYREMARRRRSSVANVPTSDFAFDARSAAAALARIYGQTLCDR